MSISEKERDKKGRSVLAICAVVCLTAALISFSVISGVCVATAQQTEDTATVTVNAPEAVKAGETLDATIDVDKIVNFNAGQFDLSFNPSVVKVEDVTDGSIDETTIPVEMWRFMERDTIRAMLSTLFIYCEI